MHGETLKNMEYDFLQTNGRYNVHCYRWKMYHKSIVVQHSVFYIADSDMYLNNNNTHRKHSCVFTSEL